MSSTDSTSNRSMKERAEDSGEYDRTMYTMEVHADILAYLHLGKDRALYGLNVPRADRVFFRRLHDSSVFQPTCGSRSLIVWRAAESRKLRLEILLRYISHTWVMQLIS